MNRCALLVAPAALALAAASASAINVNIELSLLVDVSGSIDPDEYNLQRSGYANTFTNPNFFNTVVHSGNSIAVNFIEWSSSNEQSVRSIDGSHADGWWVIASQADATAFGNMINGATRAFTNQTAPQSAMSFAAPLIYSNNIVSDRQIIDVSGDGVANSGDTGGTSGRDAAALAGVDQINGLVIGNEAAVLAYYQNRVQFGAGSFTNQVDSFNDFGSAVAEKIHLEIAGGIPLPSAASLGFLGLGVLGVQRRRR